MLRVIFYSVCDEHSGVVSTSARLEDKAVVPAKNHYCVKFPTGQNSAKRSKL
jgi:hypothetical protein